MRACKWIWKAFCYFHVLCVSLTSGQFSWIHYLIKRKKKQTLSSEQQRKMPAGVPSFTCFYFLCKNMLVPWFFRRWLLALCMEETCIRYPPGAWCSKLFILCFFTLNSVVSYACVTTEGVGESANFREPLCLLLRAVGDLLMFVGWRPLPQAYVSYTESCCLLPLLWVLRVHPSAVQVFRNHWQRLEEMIWGRERCDTS